MKFFRYLAVLLALAWMQPGTALAQDMGANISVASVWSDITVAYPTLANAAAYVQNRSPVPVTVVCSSSGTAPTGGGIVLGSLATWTCNAAHIWVQAGGQGTVSAGLQPSTIPGGGPVTAAAGSYAAGAIVDLGTGSTPAAYTVNGWLKQLNAALGTPLQAGGNVVVSGTVSVSNLPTTQPVSGSVSVSNLPTTQAISAASLPLPTGAATASGVASVVTALGTPLQANGTVTVNTPSYTLLSNASGSSSVLTSIPGGGYNLSVTGTFSGAVYAVMGTDAAGNPISLGTITAPTTPTAPFNLNLPANSSIQLVLTSGTPSGIYANLASMGAPLTLAPTTVSINNGAGGPALFTPTNPGLVQQSDMTSIPVTAGSSAGAVMFTADMTGYSGVGVTFNNAGLSNILFQQGDDGSTWGTATYVNAGQSSSSTSLSTGTVYLPKQHRYLRMLLNTYSGTGSVTATAYLIQSAVAPITTSQLNPGSATIGNIYRSEFWNEAIAQTLTATTGTFTGTARASGATNGVALPWNSFTCRFSGSATGGTLYAEGSVDGSTNWQLIDQVAQPGSAPFMAATKDPVSYSYQRCRVSNGSTTQTYSLTSTYGE